MSPPCVPVLAKEYLQRFHPDSIFRKQAAYGCANGIGGKIRFGLYNCAGLVWASRRTGISLNEDRVRILTDDGYRPISDPCLDDLVLYRDSEDGTFLHVARIVGFEKGISDKSSKIPIVLSKWGHDLGECVHFAYDLALPNSYNVSIEYWTERPKDEQPIPKPTQITLR